MVSQNGARDLRYQPLYSIMEVSRYTRVHTSTLRSWIRSKSADLLIPAGDDKLAPLSFMNLVESHVLVALRSRYHVSMPEIHNTIRYLKEQFPNVAHPLAEINLETDGKDIFFREFNHLISASRNGQMAFDPVLSIYLKRIERDPANIPIRFFPLTYAESPKVIMMDPAIAFGRPVIKGTRITTPIIFERYSGGESLREIADDYEIEISKVEEALRCEIEQRAAA